MRTTLFAAALLLTSSGETQTFTATQARMHDSENATVCGVVASERYGSGKKRQTHLH
jgi:hypothetical protein